MNAEAELEQEQAKRQEEVLFLQNVCAQLSSEEDQNRMRRSLIVMLYSHYEGFAKFTFDHYARAIENSSLKCSEVHASLATTSLSDIFKAFRNPVGAESFLPSHLRDFHDLKPFAIERAFIERAHEFGERIAFIPDKFIDMESNLKPIVLKKNLFRLGLPHDLFESLDGSIHKLLSYRNGIAHGSFVNGIDEIVYSELRDAVFAIMNQLRITILNAINSQSFRRQVS